MKIHLVFPVLPPTLDGIGDYTAHLAGMLAARGAAVKVLTAQEGAATAGGAAVDACFTVRPPYGVQALRRAVSADPPDWLVLQYNPFSYGRYGFNPWLPEVARQLKRHHPGLRLALMIHEPFVPVAHWKFALMTTWQRWQLWRLGQTADLICCSIEAWTRRFQDWFPGHRVHHLPIGSNIPEAGATREAARRWLHVDPHTCVVGLFGSGFLHGMLPAVREAVVRLRAHAQPVLLLYVGRQGAAVQDALASLPVRDAGCLPPAEVSRCFAAMDLYLAPFIDGVSTRRGSFMAGLQHGLPTLTTFGPLTDRLLRQAAGHAFLASEAGHADAFAALARRCAADDVLRTRLGRQARAFYRQHFDWPALTDTMLTLLTSTPHGPAGGSVEAAAPLPVSSLRHHAHAGSPE